MEEKKEEVKKEKKEGNRGTVKKLYIPIAMCALGLALLVFAIISAIQLP